MGEDEAALIRLWHERRGEIEPEGLSGVLLVQLGNVADRLCRRTSAANLRRCTVHHPPLPIANFRNHGELGGGRLLDMGPYAAAVMRILGGGAPSDVTALADGRHPETGVDMGFSVQAGLANGGIFSSQFSFEGEYQNRLLIVARSGSVIMEWVFSPPADHQMEWRQRVGNVENAVTFAAADTFARFLESVARAIAGGEHEPLYRDMLADAECRSGMANALEHSARRRR
jgi:predicted dehydrogenase